MFGQTEINYIVGNCGSYRRCTRPPPPGLAGAPRQHGPRLPGPPRRGDRRRRPRMPARHAGRRGGAPAATCTATPTRCSSSATGSNDDATRAKFTGDPADSWCRTGDTAVMDDDGYLWYQGRSDDMFKAAGYRIGPSEIENCLVKHPAVANAAVVPKPDAERGAVVKAYVVLAPGFAGDAGAGRGAAAARARPAGALRIPEGDRVHRRPADDDHRQGAAAACCGCRRKSGSARRVERRADPGRDRPPPGRRQDTDSQDTAHRMTHVERDLRSPLWQPLIERLSRPFALMRDDECGCGLSTIDSRGRVGGPAARGRQATLFGSPASLRRRRPSCASRSASRPAKTVPASHGRWPGSAGDHEGRTAGIAFMGRRLGGSSIAATGRSAAAARGRR